MRIECYFAAGTPLKEKTLRSGRVVKQDKIAEPISTSFTGTFTIKKTFPVNKQNITIDYFRLLTREFWIPFKSVHESCLQENNSEYVYLIVKIIVTPGYCQPL
jgi:hypothetical protein